jgi:hypothetical protein
MPETQTFRRRPHASALTAVLAMATLSFALKAQATTTFDVDVSATTGYPTGNPAQSDSVVGSVTTDGTIGVLGPSDIVSWDLNLVDGLDASSDCELTPGDSSLVEDTGSALSATSSGLSFDYSGAGEFLIQADSPGAYTGWHYFCFSTGGACLAGETISPGFIYTDGVTLTGDSAPVGNQPIGSTPGVPETPTWAMMIIGLIGLGAGLRLRRKGDAFAATC